MTPSQTEGEALTERERFEAWYDTPRTDAECETYRASWDSPTKFEAWEGWQARAALSAVALPAPTPTDLAAPALRLLRAGRQKLATYTSVYPGDKELRRLLTEWDAALASPAASPTPTDFERGRQQGMKQERALWELAASSQEIERAPPAALLVQTPGWVSVEERMPEGETTCLVWVRAKERWPAHAVVDEWRMHREDPTGMGGPTIEIGFGWDSYYEAEVTHWMPLPAAPGAVQTPSPTDPRGNWGQGPGINGSQGGDNP